MEPSHDRQYYSYTWHQSHDQATVMIMIPYETVEEDIVVAIEREYIIAGVRGQPPTVKGRLYAPIDPSNSTWQLQSRKSHHHPSSRERTTSTTSTASSSSYAFVGSDPEISSSFAASLAMDSGQVSDSDDLSSPGLPSPTLSSADERLHRHHHHAGRGAASPNAVSRSVSPGQAPTTSSSFSSLESLHASHRARLCTLHLEKERSIIWPSLVVGPAPPMPSDSVVFDASWEMEAADPYDMDPTSLVLIALDLFDIRKEREEAFEWFLRAWNQAHVPSATMKLVSHYMPLHMTLELTNPANPVNGSTRLPIRGTTAYYLKRLGGPSGLAQLYLEAGMLHLEGAASTLLSSSCASLSSLRVPSAHSPSQSISHPQISSSSMSSSGLGFDSTELGAEGGAEAWRRDRDAAGRYFDRARSLCPELDVPVLPALPPPEEALEMPSIEIPLAPEAQIDPPAKRRRRKELGEKPETRLVNKVEDNDVDNMWYLYIPALVGAGTALLVVGALSFSTWSRRHQGS